MQKQHAAVMTANTSDSNAFYVALSVHTNVEITQMQKPNANSQDAADQTICARKKTHIHTNNTDTHLPIQWRESAQQRNQTKCNTISHFKFALENGLFIYATNIII